MWPLSLYTDIHIFGLLNPSGRLTQVTIQFNIVYDANLQQSDYVYNQKWHL